ncbi:MAG: LAGLIDADG family homing endonuclease [Patescibacteria group bacterium]
MANKRYHISKKRLYYLYHRQKLSTFKIASIFNCTAGTIMNRMKEYDIKRRDSGPRRINISKDSLHLFYVKKKFSARKIAKICHCDQTAILNRLRKYNILIRQPKKKIGISKEKIEQLYIKKNLSTYKIAEIFNCTSSAIYRYLKLYEIKTRPLKRINISKNELKDFYINKKFSLSKIATIYKCSPVTIWQKMRGFNLSLRSYSEANTIHPKSNFSGDLEEKSYIIGFRIGDLGVRKDKNLIYVGCGTTKDDQIQLIKNLFSHYGPVYIGNKDKRGAIHIGCSLNYSFSFLLPKHNSIPKWILRKRINFFNFLAGYTDAEGNIGVYQGRAIFRLRSYDKGVLKDIAEKLKRLGIKNSYRLESKAYTDKRGVIHRGDTWAVTICERESLLIYLII